jgi:type I restriction enzyme S subunit
MGKKPFGELFEDATGGKPRVKQGDYKQSGVLPVVDQGVLPISGYVDDRSLACNVPLPCIVFGDHTKAVKYVDHPFAIGAEGVKILVPNAELHPRYAFYLLQRVRFPSDTGYSRHFRFLKRTRFSVPPLAEQRRIAAMLDKADAVRRKRREAVGLLDEFVHSTYLDLVGPGNRSYSTWPKCRIADLATDGPGTMRTGPFGSALRHSEFVDEGVAVLGIDNAVHNRFAWDQRRYIPEQKYEKFRRYTVRPGDVIVTIMGTTGRSAVVPEDIPLAISTKHLAVITTDRSRVQPLYLSHAVHSDPTILAQIAAANRGAIMPGLNLGLIKRLELRLPPLAAQRRFANIVETSWAARDRLASAGERADDLFNALAQRAFAVVQ